MYRDKQHRKEVKTRKRATQLVHAHETVIRSRNPAARSLSDKVLLSSQNSVPDFELLRFRNKEPGEETEDDAAVVDFVEELLDVEEPERIVVETHVEIVTSGNALGTVAQLRRTSVPSLTKHERPCMPDFGPGTSLPVRVGLQRLFSLCRIRADAPNGTRRQYGGRPPVIRQQTDCATGVVAGKDFISIAPLRGASARNCLRHLYLATCGREGNSTTPQP